MYFCPPIFISGTSTKFISSLKKGVKSLYYCRSLSIQRAEKADDDTKAMQEAMAAAAEGNDMKNAFLSVGGWEVNRRAHFAKMRKGT